METESYKKIEDLMSTEDFQKKIEENIKEFNNLIDESAAAALILDEFGRWEIKLDRISGLEIGKSVNLRVRVKNIGDIRKFSRKTGGSGEVVNIDITDGSGSVKLVLWDKDVELVRTEKIKKNSLLKIINGFVKQGRYDIEINIGRNAFIIVD